MNALPDKVDPTRMLDGYYEVDRPEHEVLAELVAGYNALIDYLRNRRDTHGQ